MTQTRKAALNSFVHIIIMFAILFIMTLENIDKAFIYIAFLIITAVLYIDTTIKYYYYLDKEDNANDNRTKK